MRAVRLALLALVVLAGCGDAEKATALEGPVTYERSGGIAGRRDRLVVQPDGSARLTVRDTTKSIRITGRELVRLGRDLEEADLGSVPRSSGTRRPVPDAFRHRVVYGGVTVDAADPRMPARLRGLMTRLSGLVERYE